MKPIEKKELAALRKRLRSFRMESGWTFQDLSLSCAVSVSQLCEFESGVSGIRRDKLAEIEKALRRALRARARRIARLLHLEQAKTVTQKPDRKQVSAQRALRSKPSPLARTEAGIELLVRQQPEVKKMPEAM